MERRTRQQILKKPRPLDETLHYFAICLQPALDNTHAKARAMGMDHRTFADRTEHPDWKLAAKIARESMPKRDETFAEYVLQQLSPEARAAWDQINFWKEHKDATQKLLAINHTVTKKIKQELFLHALLLNGFDQSRACYLTCTGVETLRQWQKRDLHFAQLMEEIHFHKKNFFEKAMVELVETRHPLAVIYANKTVNADRGYNEKIRIEHALAADSIDFGSLDLDLETKKKVLEAIRRQRAAKNETPPPRQLNPPNNNGSAHEAAIEAEVVE